MKISKSCFALLLLLCARKEATAQFQLHCQSISTIGSVSSSSDATLFEIAGQPFPTEPSANAGFTLNPGFIPCLYLGLITDVEEPASSAKIPTAFALLQNHPNPFNPQTAIVYELPKTSHVSLVVFNLLGQKVKTLMNGIVQAGTHTARWDGADESGKSVAAGFYLVRMHADGAVFVKSMTMLK